MKKYIVESQRIFRLIILFQNIILVAPDDLLNKIQDVFNSLHNRLQFTMEISTKDRLNFLDTTVIIDENRIIFNKYHKPTFSGRFLNFYSHHPSCYKRGIIIGAIDRIVLVSHP